MAEHRICRTDGLNWDGRERRQDAFIGRVRVWVIIPLERRIMADVEVKGLLCRVDEGSDGEEMRGAYGGSP